MQGGNFAHEAQPQSAASAAVGPGQGIEAIEYPVVGEVRNTGTLVADPEQHGLALAAQFHLDHAVGLRREIDRIVEQVRQRLAQQETVADHDRRRRIEARSRSAAASCPGAARRRRPPRGPAAAMSTGSTFSSDCRCSTDASASILSIIAASRADWVSMLCRNRSRSGPGGASSRISAAPRMAAIGLFISCASVCTYCSTYCLPSSRSRIVSSARPSSPISLLPSSGATTRSPAVTEPGEFAQAGQRARQPQRHANADQERQAEQDPALPEDGVLAALDEGLDALVGLGHRQHADDPIAIANRRRHVHHAAVLVVRDRSSVERAPYFPRSVRYTSFQRE